MIDTQWPTSLHCLLYPPLAHSGIPLRGQVGIKIIEQRSQAGQILIPIQRFMGRKLDREGWDTLRCQPIAGVAADCIVTKALVQIIAARRRELLGELLAAGVSAAAASPAISPLMRDSDVAAACGLN